MLIGVVVLCHHLSRFRSCLNFQALYSKSEPIFDWSSTVRPVSFFPAKTLLLAISKKPVSIWRPCLPRHYPRNSTRALLLDIEKDYHRRHLAVLAEIFFELSVIRGIVCLKSI